MTKQVQMLLRRAVSIAILAGLLSACAVTRNERASGVAKDAQLGRGAEVVILPPDVELSSLLASGLQEVRADWTQSATGHVRIALLDALKARGAAARIVEDFSALDDPDRAQQLKLLHEVVGYSVMMHGLGNGKLAHKDGFDWTLGEGARALDPKARYGLFVFIRDSYATEGRKAMLALAIVGVGVSMGQQIGFASLVDLDTGAIVWFNVLASARGDLRELDKARASIENLLTGAPL